MFGGGSRQGGSHQAPRRKTRKPAETEKYRYENLVQEDPKELEEDFNGRVAENLGYKKSPAREKTAEQRAADRGDSPGMPGADPGDGPGDLHDLVHAAGGGHRGAEHAGYGRAAEPAETPAPGETATPEPSPTATPEVPVRRENTYTILVVGRDGWG